MALKRIVAYCNDDFWTILTIFDDFWTFQLPFTRTVKHFRGELKDKVRKVGVEFARMMLT